MLCDIKKNYYKIMLFTKHLIEVSKKVFVLKVINCILIAIVPGLLFYSFFSLA
jgi:hypothetical protein